MAALRYVVGPTDFTGWDALHRLLVECFAYMEGRIDPPSSLKGMTPETLREKAAGETLVLVYDGDTLAGCGYLKVTEDAIYLGKLAVRAAFRGQGILREIVAIATRLAVARRKTALELETRVELVENHRTFAALGFRKTAWRCHAGYDRPTSITITKAL